MKTLCCISLSVVLLSSAYAQGVPPEVAAVLQGKWTWTSYSGGFGGIPPSNATSLYTIYFTHTDTATNLSILCTAYEDTTLLFSQVALTFTKDTINTYFPYRVEPDITNYPLNQIHWPHVDFRIISHDSIEFTHKEVIDDFSFLFVRSCCNVSAKAGIYDSVDWKEITYKVDQIKKHQWACGGTGGYDGGLTIAVFDSTGCTNWESKFSDKSVDPVTGYSYNRVHKNIHCKTRDLQAFDFPTLHGDPNKMALLQQRVIDFVNSIPDSNYILVYSVNHAGYSTWSQNLIDVFTDLGSNQITTLTTSNTRQWTFFVKKGAPATVVEEAAPEGVDSAQLSATLSCPVPVIDTATAVPEIAPGISIQPNPAADFVQIRCSILPEKIKLLNAVGQEIKQVRKPSLPLTLNLQGLEKGVYFIRIETDGKFFMKEVVKL